MEGKLERNLDGEALKERLRMIQDKQQPEEKKVKRWKGRKKNGKETDQ